MDSYEEKLAASVVNLSKLVDHDSLYDLKSSSTDQTFSMGASIMMDVDTVNTPVEDKGGRRLVDEELMMGFRLFGLVEVEPISSSLLSIAFLSAAKLPP